METVDLKLVLLGQPGVGKTCLVYRYLYNTFGETISVRRRAPSHHYRRFVLPLTSLCVFVCASVFCLCACVRRITSPSADKRRSALPLR
jgi:GTPase SAR1 family protein